LKCCPMIGRRMYCEVQSHLFVFIDLHCRFLIGLGSSLGELGGIFASCNTRFNCTIQCCRGHVIATDKKTIWQVLSTVLVAWPTPVNRCRPGSVILAWLCLRNLCQNEDIRLSIEKECSRIYFCFTYVENFL
jgi:hypothetical protein